VVAQDEMTIRLKIVSFAWGYTQCGVGAHYKRGCFGALPGGADQIHGRYLALVHDWTWDNLGIFTCERDDDVLGGVTRCQGRYGRVGGGEICGRDLQKLKEWAERWRTARQTDLLVEPAAFDPARGSSLTPRRLFKGDRNSMVLLGEDCRSKPHFDCIGFVDFVLTKILCRTIQYGIPHFLPGSPIAPGEFITPPPSDSTRVFPGDVLARQHHIGFAGKSGQVIDAHGDNEGVVERPYVHSEWESQCRLSREFLGLPARFTA
jgi:hypothetical protein